MQWSTACTYKRKTMVSLNVKVYSSSIVRHIVPTSHCFRFQTFFNRVEFLCERCKCCDLTCTHDRANFEKAQVTEPTIVEAGFLKTCFKSSKITPKITQTGQLAKRHKTAHPPKRYVHLRLCQSSSCQNPLSQS